MITHDIKKLIFIDIETATGKKDFTELTTEEASLWTKYSKVYSDDNDISELDPFNYRKASLSPEFGKIVCITLSCFIETDGIETTWIKSFIGNEKQMLIDVRTALNRSSAKGFFICGHNIKFFDIPYIAKRCFINGLKTPDIFPGANTKPWEIKCLDTRDLWNSGVSKGMISSLELVCEVLGIKSSKEGEVKGENVSEVFYNGGIKLIKEYCERDVIATMEIVKKLNNLE